MTEIGDPALGSVAGGGKPVLAFETDSMQALALVYELLDEGVDVARARDAFTAGGRSFTPAPRSSTRRRSAAWTSPRWQRKRQTPVTGLDDYPVHHYPMVKPKIGVYSQATTVPNSPLEKNAAAPSPGHCATQVARRRRCGGLLRRRCSR